MLKELESIPWKWAEHLGDNRVAPRATLYPYPTETSAKSCDRSKSKWVKILNGKWSFQLFDRPKNVPDAVVGADDTASGVEEGEGWSDIVVPGNWTMQGYDRPYVSEHRVDHDVGEAEKG